MRPTTAPGTIIVLLIAVALAACGSGDGVVDLGSAPERVTASATPTRAADAGAGLSEPAAPVDGPDAPADDGDDPRPGADGHLTAGVVGVVGVEGDDVLNVRAQPGADQPIIDRLAPLRLGLTYTGAVRTVDGAPWPQIAFDGIEGWVNGRYVRAVGGTDDITAQVVAGDQEVTAPTMEDLAEEVVDRTGLSDGYEITWGPDRDPAIAPEAQRRVVVSGGPAFGDVAEITLDVIDLFDDAVAAQRLAIVARPADDGSVTLLAVERTQFCWRGGGDRCA